MRSIVLRSGSWSVSPAFRATGFRDRLFGLKRLPTDAALLLKRRSVHGFGIDEPFHAVGLTRELKVRSVAFVEPGTMVSFRGCRFVLELPATFIPPQRGAHLEIADD